MIETMSIMDQIEKKENTTGVTDHYKTGGDEVLLSEQNHYKERPMIGNDFIFIKNFLLNVLEKQ